MKIILPYDMESVSVKEIDGSKFYGWCGPGDYGDETKEVSSERKVKSNIGNIMGSFFQFDTVLELNNWLNS